MATNWSTYQQDVFNFVANGDGSAVISAVAGSGKTTTIVECAKRIPKNKSVLFLAFNNSIVHELETRLKANYNVTCKTTHSLGMAAIKSAMGYVRVYDKKYFARIVNDLNIISTVIDDQVESKVKYAFVNNVLKLFNLCRINLIKASDRKGIENVALNYHITSIADEIHAVSVLLETAYTLNRGEMIDFNDMLALACTKFANKVTKYDFVFIDECQDLNAAQRKLLTLALKPNGRFIAVGDRRQAINGFCGATNNSFDLLAELAHHNELPLSVNYRCGSDIIELAKEIVPQISAFEGASKGAVHNVTDLKAVRGNDMILCRKTAPLIRLCLKMLKNNIIANIKGADMGKTLLDIIKRINPKNITDLFITLQSELENLKKDERKKKNATDFEEIVECLNAFGETAATIKEMINNIENIFSDKMQRNAIILSSVHRSKGLEADNVFIILPNKLPLNHPNQSDWEKEQELNLKYVAITRAKKNLYFVNLDEKQLSKVELPTD